ncbi:hypothetical protein [Acinetobacter junii]|uniref:hypothetical protein n=1 Tax=Acinetobacter junii TaxID=40215 RepID=UPI00190272FB|nr:hypothetical protein [Acinetobacter junii]MBJ8440044.1 hypothetical protein [Acinetobacter junii]
MTFYIGGSCSGLLVEQQELHNDTILKPFGPYTGFSRKHDVYTRRKISFHGTVKTFYLLDSVDPKDCRDQILELWDKVKTDIYTI